MGNEEYQAQQSIINQEQPTQVKPWVRAVALLVVLCLFYQGVVFGAAPDWESALNLKLPPAAPLVEQSVTLSSIGSLFKALFITEAYADDNGNYLTEPKPVRASSNSSPAEKSYSATNAFSAYLAGEKASAAAAGAAGGKSPAARDGQAAGSSYAPGNSATVSTASGYRAQGAVSPSVIPAAGSWLKTGGYYSSPLAASPSARIRPQAGAQSAAEPAYYIDIRPALPKTGPKTEVALERRSVEKEKTIVTQRSSLGFTRAPLLKSKLGQESPSETVMINKAGLAVNEEIKTANRFAGKNTSVKLIKSAISQLDTNSGIHFIGLSPANIFYKPPAFTCVNVLRDNAGQMKQRISTPQEVFVELPKIFVSGAITGYADISRQDNLALAAGEKEDNQGSRASSAGAKQPLALPTAPVNAAQPPANNAAPGPGGPDSPTSNSTSTTSSSSNTAARIHQPYGHPPLTIPLPAFPLAGSYETVLTTLAKLYGEELTSARGDGGITVPGSGILPSPEAGRNREGSSLPTPFHLISHEAVLLLWGKTPENSSQKHSDSASVALKAGVKTHPEEGVFFAFSGHSPIPYSNIGKKSLESLANSSGGGEPFRRALRSTTLSAGVNRGNNAPVSVFLTLKTDTGALPQSLVSRLGVFVPNFMGVR